jgi:hypothetical protein
MEFLRFGSSIPGGYWGCCACCIIQNFKFDPSDKASIQLVSGDSGTGVRNGNAFAGPTYEDIFRTRIRIGTFSDREMPNHAFLAILTQSQISGGVGAKWLKILKEEGFEFIRTVDNSVYTGQGLLSEPGGTAGCSSHANHIFGLFRNIGTGAVKDQFMPPKAWTDLEKVVPEAWENLASVDTVELTKSQQSFHLDRWKKGETKILTKAEIKAAGAPVTMAGQRLPHAGPESEEKRLKAKEEKADKAKAKASAFPPVPAAA